MPDGDMTDDDGAVELPFPVPQDLSDSERAAYLRGARTMAQLMAGQASGIENALGDAIGGGDTTDRGGDGGRPSDNPDSDGSDTCGDCGEKLMEAFGGAMCPNCDA